MSRIHRYSPSARRRRYSIEKLRRASNDTRINRPCSAPDPPDAHHRSSRYEFLRQGTPGKIQRGLAEVNAKLILAGVPDHPGRCVRPIGGNALHFPAMKTRPVSVGDLREQPKHPEWRGRVIGAADRHAGDADPYWRAVAAAQAKIEWPASPANVRAKCAASASSSGKTQPKQACSDIDSKSIPRIPPCAGC